MIIAKIFSIRFTLPRIKSVISKSRLLLLHAVIGESSKMSEKPVNFDLNNSLIRKGRSQRRFD